jgi:acetyltransferase-like isoleucine patch superfamily enzyme
MVFGKPMRVVRQSVGRFVDACAEIVSLLHITRYRLFSRLGVITYQQASESVSRIGTFFGYRVRQRFYRHTLDVCGQDLEMNRLATVAERGSRIGRGVWVGPGSYLDLVDIGDDVLIGPYACILAGGHHHRVARTDLPIRHQGNNPLVPTVVGAGSWIGAHAVVMADVGRSAVVGAGSVVTHPVPAGVVVVGNPAHVIARRNEEERT